MEFSAMWWSYLNVTDCQTDEEIHEDDAHEDSENEYHQMPCTKKYSSGQTGEKFLCCADHRQAGKCRYHNYAIRLCTKLPTTDNLCKSETIVSMNSWCNTRWVNAITCKVE